ncbi:YwqG family protein [Staphylococcus chromogenes]|nr:YwqG family protein [Staphylococcus chromogenes]
MFLTQSELDTALDNLEDKEAAEILRKAYRPVAAIEPDESADRVGGTRITGTPDVPAGFDWPQMNYNNLTGIDANFEHDARFDGKPLPFVAQIDLAELAATQVLGSTMPTEGRLLFFMDTRNVDSYPHHCNNRVLWDRTPIDALTSHPLPEELRQATITEYGEDQDDGAFYGVKTPAKISRGLGIFSTNLPEFDALLADASEGTAEAVHEYTYEVDGDEFPEDSWHRNTVLALPIPEQNDPREIDNLTPRGEWQVLLQLSLDEWWGEGTVYFIIDSADLAEGNFDNVLALYQQT